MRARSAGPSVLHEMTCGELETNDSTLGKRWLTQALAHLSSRRRVVTVTVFSRVKCLAHLAVGSAIPWYRTLLWVTLPFSASVCELEDPSHDPS